MSQNTFNTTKTKYENEYAIIDEYLDNDCEKIKQAYSSQRLDEYHRYYDLFVHVKNLSAYEIQMLNPKTQNRIKRFQDESMKLENFFEKQSFILGDKDKSYIGILDNRRIDPNIKKEELEILTSILNNKQKIQSYLSLMLEKKYLETYIDNFKFDDKNILEDRLDTLSSNLKSIVEKDRLNDDVVSQYNELYLKTLEIESKIGDKTNELDNVTKGNLETELRFINEKINDIRKEYPSFSFSNGIVTNNSEYIDKMKEKIKNFTSLGGNINEIPYDNNGKIIAFVNSVSSLDDVNFDEGYALIDEKKFMIKFLKSLHTEELPDNLTNYLSFVDKEQKLQKLFKDKNLNEFKQILTDLDNDINTFGFNDDTIYTIVNEKYGIDKNTFSEYLVAYQKVKTDFKNDEEFYNTLNSFINKKSADYKEFLFNGDYDDCRLSLFNLNGVKDLYYKQSKKKFDSTQLYPLNNETDLYKSAKNCNKDFNLDNLSQYTKNLENMMGFVDKYQNFGPVFEEYQKAILEKDDEKANKLGLDLIKKINPNDTFFEEFKSFTQQNNQNIGALYREYTSSANQYTRQLKDLERNVKLVGSDIMNPLTWVIPFGLIKNNLNIVAQQLRIYSSIRGEEADYLSRVQTQVNKGFQEFLRDYVNSSTDKKEQLRGLLENLSKSGKLKGVDVDKFMKNIENFSEGQKDTVAPFNDIKRILIGLNGVDINNIDSKRLLHGDFSEFKNDVSKGFTKSYLSTYMQEAIDTKHVIDTLTSKTETLSTKHENIIEKTQSELKITNDKLKELEALEKRVKKNSDDSLDKDQILKDIKLNEKKVKDLEENLKKLINLNPILMRDTLNEHKDKDKDNGEEVYNENKQKIVNASGIPNFERKGVDMKGLSR